MGKLRDEEVAARTGHPIGSVRAKRRELGRPLAQPGWRLWTPAEEALLGTDTDKAVAARLKRSRKAVRMHRGHLGIPPHPT